MNPFVKTARVALTSTLTAGTLATIGLVLAPAAQADYSPLAATTDVNVRQAPDTASTVVATLSHGDTVTQRGTEQDGWLPIIYNGSDAWIQAQYVASTTAATADDEVTQATVTTDAYVRTDADSTAWVLGTAYEGDQIGITGDPVGNWTPVNFYGRAGWISTKLLTTDDASAAAQTITKAISQDYLWVRTGESTAATNIGMLYPGDEVEVTGSPVGGWVPILYKDQAAFVAANYSRYVTDPAVVNLSAKTDTEAAATPQADTTAETAAPAATVTKYTTTDVNVRVGPGTDQESVTVLPQNSEVQATGQTSGDWSEITYEGASRWINTAFLSDTQTAVEEAAPAEEGPSAGATPTTVGTRYTTAPLNAYLSSTQGKPGTTVIAEGTAVEITGAEENGRSQYVLDGTTYWSATEYLSTDAPTVSETPAPSANAAQTAIDFAMSKLGGPYVWGGTGPVGYDCSGLTQAAYAAAGISLPRVTWDQVNAGTQVSVGDLQPGDLVFFYDNGHVGIYIGNGNIVNALNEDAGIVITPISYMPISAAVRVA